jgi:hypothetical protein
MDTQNQTKNKRINIRLRVGLRVNLRHTKAGQTGCARLAFTLRTLASRRATAAGDLTCHRPMARCTPSGGYRLQPFLIARLMSRGPCSKKSH